MTFGERAVGVLFNPSGDSKVTLLKALFAQIIDVCNDARAAPSCDPESKRLFSIAITESQGAQMWAVKAVTWREWRD